MALSFFTKLAYSVGHVQNDLCASMWFSYLLIFFNLVLGLESKYAGLLMTIGQVADAISTPFVGFCSDRGGVFCCSGYGRRKSWHLLGTICVVASFPFVFASCINCADSDMWAKLLYFSVFICVFQFGWASIQISNLSVVPELTPDEHERTALLAYRYTFTVISNMTVYVVIFLALRLGGVSETQVGPHQLHIFQYVTVIILVIGTFTSLLYHIGVKERIRDDAILQPGDTEFYQRTKFADLFKDWHLYKVAIVYMATRLFVNMSQVLIPLYLQYFLLLPSESIATVPFVVFTMSFLTSLIIKPLNQRFGRKLAYSLGVFIGVASSIIVYFGHGEVYNRLTVFAVAALFGCASSVMLVTSLGVTADHIGQDLDNGALIYGLMSFVDKISNGFAILVIQSMKKQRTHYRDCLSFVCGVSAIIGLIAIFTFSNTNRNDNRNSPEDNRGFEPEIQSSAGDINRTNSESSTIVVAVTHEGNSQ
ncbi:major facilitator superfamily domain-containing protein 12-like isoform X2 [Nilaparvata lugens]|nr:major facilitator superfamily domain-containing protein 12-like isoform X2 [Nilaparvata lugens]XP_039277979.1 major facilitator superfamily domain-containing protein 12-like isoform X2 [Nilaparvata lugens]XP_039277980.1 major facilitator superfamily domain-containing protein 12-like isoform X2 [Nilaparvata lugens]XP_039277981.1 major facilitator superfamily domain-containing protein 12-like isoform X2 [Nilaparvata lugens]